MSDRYSLIIPLSYTLSMALIGVIANTSYYLDIPTKLSIKFIYITAIILLPLLWKFKIYLKFNNISLSLGLVEKIIIGAIIYMILHYLFRSFAPWSDQDEINLYGYQTKLIANGFTYSDSNIIKYIGWPQFGESLFAYFYYVSDSTILPKIFKVIGLITTAQLLYFITNYITRNTKYSLIAALCFLITPEFSYMATSLKTDNLMMVFEFTGIVLAILLFYERKKLSTINFRNYALIAIFMGIVASSIRLSALYSLLLISYLLFHLLVLKNFRQSIVLVILSFLISLPVFLGYWFNLHEYGNPFYPIGFNIMDYIPQMQYDEFWKMDNRKAAQNIILNNKIIEYFYVAAYMSFGLATQLFDSFTQIVHPIDRGSSVSWANPILVIMFLAIFLIKENKIIILPITMYFVLYTFWFLGIQHTRVFFSSTALAVFCYACFIKYDYNLLHNKVIKKILVMYITLIIPVFVLYHTLYTYIRMPNNIYTVISPEERYKSNLNYYAFMSNSLGGNYNPKFPLTSNDVLSLDKFMSKNKKIKIASSMTGPIHMFFKYGYIHSNIVDYDCLLSTYEYKEMKNIPLSKKFDYGLYKLWCKIGI